MILLETSNRYLLLQSLANPTHQKIDRSHLYLAVSLTVEHHNFPLTYNLDSCHLQHMRVWGTGHVLSRWTLQWVAQDGPGQAEACFGNSGAATEPTLGIGGREGGQRQRRKRAGAGRNNTQGKRYRVIHGSLQFWDPTFLLTVLTNLDAL